MALIDERYDGLLRDVARALSPYLGDILVIGGAANALYRHHRLASASTVPPLLTKDLDLASPTALPRAERPAIAQLLGRANFAPSLHGRCVPPVMKFVRAGDADAAEIEFVCPLLGSGGEANELLTIEIQPGVSAQALRYVDLLLFEPWNVAWETIPGFGDLADLAPVRIPNPVTYVMQKVLLTESERRSKPKRQKDCYYIYEVAHLFRDATPELSEVLKRIAHRFPPRWHKRFAWGAGRLFSGPHSVGPISAEREIREAAKLRPALTPIDAAMIHATVLKFMHGLGAAQQT